MPQRPARAEQPGTVKRVADAETGRDCRIDDRADLVTHVTEAQHDAFDALAVQQLELMKYERAPGDREQGLR